MDKNFTQGATPAGNETKGMGFCLSCSEAYELSDKLLNTLDYMYRVSPEHYRCPECRTRLALLH